MKIKTSELTGIHLTWAIAGIVKSEKWRLEKYEGGLFASLHGYSPHSYWGQGGLLVDEFDIWFSSEGDVQVASVQGAHIQEGKTKLIAACRAIVAAHLGDEVDVPDELMAA